MEILFVLLLSIHLFLGDPLISILKSDCSRRGTSDPGSPDEPAISVVEFQQANLKQSIKDLKSDIRGIKSRIYRYRRSPSGNRIENLNEMIEEKEGEIEEIKNQLRTLRGLTEPSPEIIELINKIEAENGTVSEEREHIQRHARALSPFDHNLYDRLRQHDIGLGQKQRDLRMRHQHYTGLLREWREPEKY